MINPCHLLGGLDSYWRRADAGRVRASPEFSPRGPRPSITRPSLERIPLSPEGDPFLVEWQLPPASEEPVMFGLAEVRDPASV